MEGGEPVPEKPGRVLKGGAHLGKTRFAQSIFDAAEAATSESQRLGEDEPNLREWCADAHKCIIFDDAEWPQIANNTTLDQDGKNVK